MGQYAMFEYFRGALVLFVTMAMPPLLVALVVGVVVSLVQAVTQIQDQTMPLTFKIFTVIATLGLISAGTFSALMDFTGRIFAEFPGLTR